MRIFLEILLIAIASLNLLLTRFALFKLHQPTTPLVWFVKVSTSGLSPILLLIGLLTTLAGLILKSLPLLIIGGASAIFYLFHIVRITRGSEGLSSMERTFRDARGSLSGRTNSYFLRNRYAILLPRSPNPTFSRDIPFYTIQDSNRQLLCDVWVPPENVNRSGLAFIYLHGSAWTVLDKDLSTRPFFRHLAAQGHVIMDVAYRLFPETDFMGMVHDTKHAIAWMKTNAVRYGVNPSRIVIGGGSAGAHLALLAAYTENNRELTPTDLLNVDLSVHGVISMYGQSDLSATYYHTCQHLTTHSAIAPKKSGSPGGMPLWLQKRMGKNFHRLGFDKNVQPGMLAPMLGGEPDKKPEAYARYSPVTYVHDKCPPTLFIHGEQDILAPLYAIHQLKAKLIEKRTSVAMHVIPQTDHAFDLMFPRISPSAHNAIYDIERFLAISTYANSRTANL
jgi:acetyl esterase/lipase